VRGREPNVQLQSFTISPAGALMRLTMLPGKKAGLTALGQAGHIYEVQTTRDLKNWSVLGNVTADSTGAFSYTDNTASSYTYRCYRVRDTTP
jgi:hypothetical protein